MRYFNEYPNYQVFLGGFLPTDTGIFMPLDNAGNTLSAALAINLNSNTQSFSDWIGIGDTNDYYGLNLIGRSSFNVCLNSLSADVNLELLNSSGGLIARSDNTGSFAESINSILDGGSYYIRVYQGLNNSSSNYNLVVTSQNNYQNELVLRHSSTGQNALWQMNNTTLVGGASFTPLADNNWKIEDTGDFNCDGNNDLVLRNYATGQNALWYMNSNTLLGGAYFPQLTDTNWKIEGTGDFNRDGNNDLVLRNYATGQNALWYMNNTTLLGGAYFQQLADPNWKIEGTGDFNRDGNSDLVLRNYATGQNALWYMNNTTLLGGAYFQQLADTNWKIEGTGDFNHDGNSDLVLRNYATGQNALWYMNNTTLLGGTSFQTLTDTNWKITSVGTKFYEPTAIDVAGNNTATAFYAGDINNSTGTFRDRVDATDSNDYYWFNIATNSNFTLSLSGLTADANLQLLDSNGVVLQGSYNSGTTDEAISRQLTTGNYYIRVYQSSGNSNYNLNLCATQVESPFVTLTSPNGGESFQVGSTYNITWNDNIAENVKIDLYKAGSLYSTLFSSTLSDGIESWYVPTNLVAGSDYQIRVSSTTNANVWDFGNSYFSVTAPFLAVTSPNGGESFQAGSTYNITWNDNIAENVKIDLYKAGSLYSTLFSSTLSDGIESWYVPTNLVAGSDYQIRVSSTTNANVWDFGNSYFSVTAPFLAVTSPNGGESLQAGSTYNITWNDNIAENVKIDLYKAGSLYSTLFSSTLSDGIESWYVSTNLVAGSDYQIRISSTTNANIGDFGNSYFSVTAPFVTVTSPNGGESFQAGSTYNITWNDNIAENVKIDLYKAGSLYSTLFSSTLSDGIESWYVPTNLVAGSDYQIRVSSTTNANIGDFGNSYFSVSPFVTVPSTYQPFNASQVFSLNSNAGANHTIYLDFNGHTTTGTSWNSQYASSIVSPAYDTDGNASTFSNTELENIWNIWRRVAEDFIPFNVNVTTANPSTSDLINSGSGDTRWGVRVVISGNSSWYGSYGGVAYVDSFNWNSDTPAFVFSDNLSNGNVKDVAEAISHEVGHTLGLDHDGKTDGTKYYQGHQGWASIMGVGYYQELTQWSRGQYSGANNTEDDLAIITGNNGFGYRTDDYGSSLSSASNLSFSGFTVKTYGIIERNTDSDWFTFNSNGGNLALNINAFEVGANLDILVQLYDSFGQLIANYDPTDSLSVILNKYLSAGKYYLSVKGTGKGDLITGYSNYASLGQYSITGTVA
ncbi:hypothetical protein NIES2107_59830 [Nostoc carneum NIES-2107]|nr:hypothetical protein NIES2107_59830 [Nostoc carneum NIES-2107]